MAFSRLVIVAGFRRSVTRSFSTAALLKRQPEQSTISRPQSAQPQQLTPSRAEHNAHLIRVLSDHMYELEHNPDASEAPQTTKFKIRAYERAIKALRALDYRLDDLDEAKRIRGIGARILERLTPHIDPNAPVRKTRKTKNVKRPFTTPTLSPEDRRLSAAIDTLQTVSGIGKVKATSLASQGCFTIQDLRTKPEFKDQLNSQQVVGLRYLDDIQTPVTRSEAELVLEFVRTHIGGAESYDFELCGSYRRDQASSSDIDLAIFYESSDAPIPTPPLPSKPGALKPSPSSKGKGKAQDTQESQFIVDIITPLQKQGLLSASLSSGTSKWQGMALILDKDSDADPSERLHLISCKNDGQRQNNASARFRRIDINFIPKRCKGAALLSLTGDTEFNRDLRYTAIKLGMRLNEFGLWRWQIHHDGDESSGEWVLVHSESEEQIVEELGKQWVEPSKRNWGFLTLK